MTRLVLACLLCATLGDISHAGRLARQAGSTSQVHDSTGERIDVNLTIEILEAIQAELLETGLCKGGEPIDVWMKRCDRHAATVELIYVVPRILHVYRMAYVQNDGSIVLSDDLAFADRQTRYSIREVVPSDLPDLSNYHTHIASRLGQVLTDRQKRLHSSREKRKEESLRQP